MSDSTIEKLAVKHGVLAEYKPMLDKLPTLKESRERLLEKITKFCNEYASQLSTDTDGWVSVETALPDGDIFVDVVWHSKENKEYVARECSVGFVGGKWNPFGNRHPAEFISYWKPMPRLPINAISQDKGESV